MVNNHGDRKSPKWGYSPYQLILHVPSHPGYNRHHQDDTFQKTNSSHLKIEGFSKLVSFWDGFLAGVTFREYITVPSRKLTYPTLGKGNSSSSSNMPYQVYQVDMLVPWRVYFFFVRNPFSSFARIASWLGGVGIRGKGQQWSMIHHNRTHWNGAWKDLSS